MKNDSGFTLLEMMIVVSLVGVMGAIAAPSFLQMNNNAKLNDALQSMEGALQEAQTQARRMSKTCTVTVAEGNNVTLTASPNSCFITGTRTLNGVNIDNRDSTGDVTGSQTIAFDFKGRTGSQKYFLLKIANTSAGQKCIANSAGVGLIRKGTWNSTTSLCEADQIN